MHGILWDFEIQKDHEVSIRSLNLVLINNKKRTCYLEEFVVSADHRVKMKKGEKLDKYLDLLSEIKMLWNMKVTSILIVVGALRTVPNNIKKIEGTEDQMKYWDHPDHSTVKVCLIL